MKFKPGDIVKLAPAAAKIWPSSAGLRWKVDQQVGDWCSTVRLNFGVGIKGGLRAGLLELVSNSVHECQGDCPKCGTKLREIELFKFFSTHCDTCDKGSTNGSK
jgi:hypothetical protein